MVSVLVPNLNPRYQELSPGSLFQGRLVRGNNNTLGVVPTEKGNRCCVNGVLFTLPPEGLVQQTTNPQLIDANGASTGAATVASTVYHAYMSDHRASPFPCTLRLSTVAPTTDSDGVRRLGTTDNASCWMYVGTVFMDASNILLDVNNTRHVGSWFNPQPIRCHIPIGWTGAGGPVLKDFNAQANYGVAFDTLAIGQSSVLSLIDMARDDMHVMFQGNMSSSAAAEWTVCISTGLGPTPSVAAPTACHQDGPVTGGVGRGYTIGYWQRANGAPTLRTFTLTSRSAASTLMRGLAELVNNGLVGAGPVGMMFSAVFWG